MTPVKAEPNLSLWQIENALVELIAAREDIEAGLAAGPDASEAAILREELQEVTKALEEYVRQEIAKVDRIAGFIRHAGMMAEQAREESNRLAERARTWERRIERLKAMCQDVMEQTGVKRIEGAHNTLRIQGNGGLAPLVVTDEAQVPEECCKYVGWISGPMWAAIKLLLSNYDVPADDFRMQRTVDNDAVRRNLPVPGAHLGERGKHLRVE